MTIAEKLLRTKSDFDEVYSAGYEKGRSEGDSWYDTFWDNYQDYGNRTVYGNIGRTQAFCGAYWSDITFKPKYDIKPTNAYSMFENSSITDLKGLLNELGIVLDLSNCKDSRYIFASSKITHLGVVDLSKEGYTMETQFSGCSELVSIDLLRVCTDVRNTLGFSKCTKLEHLQIDGEIHYNVTAKQAPLTAESAKSIINHLKNCSGTDEEFVYTITFSETTWGYLDAEGDTASPNGNSWREYINDLGWNIS